MVTLYHFNRDHLAAEPVLALLNLRRALVKLSGADVRRVLNGGPEWLSLSRPTIRRQPTSAGAGDNAAPVVLRLLRLHHLLQLC